MSEYRPISRSTDVPNHLPCAKKGTGVYVRWGASPVAASETFFVWDEAIERRATA